MGAAQWWGLAWHARGPRFDTWPCVLVTFLTAVTKYPRKATYGRRVGFSSQFEGQSITAGKIWWQGFEEAELTASSANKQRDECWHSVIFLFLNGPGSLPLEWCHLLLGSVFPPQLTHHKNCFMDVLTNVLAKVILNFVKLMINIKHHTLCPVSCWPDTREWIHIQEHLKNTN